jgi:4-amino-4-deoxy-L-arabinose transferase-like glycosyltransferase
MKLLTDKAIVGGLVVFTLAEGLAHFGLVYPDSPGYIAAARFFQGKGVPAGGAEFRLLRPLVPFLASLVNYFVDIRTSFALVNLVFWCAAVVLMFYFTKMLTKDTNASLLSAALLTSAIPLLLFGDAVLTDMAGYFFILLGTYLVIKWDIPHATLQRVCLAGLIVTIGILSREVVASVLIFASVWTLLSKGSISRLIIFLSIPIGISLLWSFAVGVSYATWYTQGGLAFAAAHQQLSLARKGLRLLGSIQYAFGNSPEVIALAALGLLRIKSKGILKMHIALLIGAFAVILAWPIIDTRFTFILFLSILPLAGAGLGEAYTIFFDSNLIHTIWPSFRDTKKTRFAFLLLVILVYALITNIVLRRYFSFPWNPYTDPSVKPTDIA